MMDDLRDYRFYESDMLHPTAQAVEYIADRFFDVALSSKTKKAPSQPTKTNIVAKYKT
jgi:hypothetical protein